MTRELYLSIVLDRASGKPVMMASAAGGMDIEEVAASTPEKIVKVFIEPGVGLVPFEARQLGFAIGLDGPQVNKAVKLMTALYETFVATDASLVEINPLVMTESGDLLALDAKMNFDDNALYRHPDIRDLRDLERRGPARDRSVEVLAQLHPPGRQHRLHGERRRPGDGHDGHHQAGGRRAGQLPGCGRRRERRADPQRVQDSDVGQERESGADQHLRRHPALRRAGAGRDRGRQGARRAGADRDPDGRHQRRRRQAPAEGKRDELHDRRLDGRGGDRRSCSWRDDRTATKARRSRRNSWLDEYTVRARKSPFVVAPRGSAFLFSTTSPSCLSSRGRRRHAYVSSDRQIDSAPRPGADRPRGDVSRQAGGGVRDDGGGRRHARARAARPTRAGRSSTRCARRSRRPARTRR